MIVRGKCRSTERPYRFVWVECNARPGMFVHERIVELYNGNTFLGSAFVDKNIVKNNSYVKALVLFVNLERVLVWVPGGFHPDTSVWIPKDKTHPVSED